MESPAEHGEQQPDPLALDDSRSISSASSPAPADMEESDFFNGNNDSQSSLGLMLAATETENDDDTTSQKLAPIEKLPSEILMAVFSKLTSTSDLYRCLLVSKTFASNVVELLWHRPSCSNLANLLSICRVLDMKSPIFQYRRFVRRLNLASLGDDINDGTIVPLAVCSRIERLTLSGCKNITDTGLVPMLENSSCLLALDVSGVIGITGLSIDTIATHCKKLQGLNVSSCAQISNESLVNLAKSCKYIKRIKLNKCSQVQNDAVMAFAENCPNILEIDLQQCTNIGVGPVTALLSRGQSLRELKLAECDLIDDSAFLSLPPDRMFEHLRILDLTNCALLTDAAVQKIIAVAPRLRNLFLAKCRNLTDTSVCAISELGKNLHYLHLGHCNLITDEGVKKLVQNCTRIRYIDLGCCANLTDSSITLLAGLQKLKRIGLVKCQNITNESVLALAGRGRLPHHAWQPSSLERVHLSYCVSLTLEGIYQLLISCPRLTHLSLTGVHAFLTEDFQPYCRPAPADFTPHQRNVFCVFSGIGVTRLRDFLSTVPKYSYLRQRLLPQRPQNSMNHSPSLHPRGLSHHNLFNGVPLPPPRAQFQPVPLQLGGGVHDDPFPAIPPFVFQDDDWPELAEMDMRQEGETQGGDTLHAMDQTEMDLEDQIIPTENESVHGQTNLAEASGPGSSANVILTHRPSFQGGDASSSASAAGLSATNTRYFQPTSAVSMFLASGPFGSSRQGASTAGMVNRSTDGSNSGEMQEEAMQGVQENELNSPSDSRVAQPHL